MGNSESQTEDVEVAPGRTLSSTTPSPGADSAHQEIQHGSPPAAGLSDRPDDGVIEVAIDD